MIGLSSLGSRWFPASSGTASSQFPVPSSQFPFPTHGVGELRDLERKSWADGDREINLQPPPRQRPAGQPPTLATPAIVQTSVRRRLGKGS